MTLCPKFYCSKCKFSHADECSEFVRKTEPVTVRLSNNSWYPMLGTVWFPEVQDRTTMAWRRSSTLDYKVTQQDRVKGEVTVSFASSNYTYKRECWDDAGGSDGGGTVLRWRPVP